MKLDEGEYRRKCPRSVRKILHALLRDSTFVLLSAQIVIFPILEGGDIFILFYAKLCNDDKNTLED